MDKRGGFWQVDQTAAPQELLAFITHETRVLKGKVMPFAVANATALFKDLKEQNFVYTEAQASSTRVDFTSG